MQSGITVNCLICGDNGAARGSAAEYSLPNFEWHVKKIKIYPVLFIYLHIVNCSFTCKLLFGREVYQYEDV